MQDEIYDTPVFKVLAANDTGSAPGHQGGIVIPKDIASYFPQLKGETSKENPTIDQDLEVRLFVGEQSKGTVTTRYQFQTWGATRRAERRLTSNLGMVRDVAEAGDIILFQRSLETPDTMKLTLIKKDSPLFSKIRQQIGQKGRWGVLDNLTGPASNTDIEKAALELDRGEQLPFVPLVEEVKTTESRSIRVARAIVFRRRVLDLHGQRCAITRKSLVSPDGATGIDAAHIIPLARRGADDPRNGLALSKEVHWAFDKGLIGIADDRTVIVPGCVKNDGRNEFLRSLEGLQLEEARCGGRTADPAALKWHRENLLLRG